MDLLSKIPGGICFRIFTGYVHDPYLFVPVVSAQPPPFWDHLHMLWRSWVYSRILVCCSGFQVTIIHPLEWRVWGVCPCFSRLALFTCESRTAFSTPSVIDTLVSIILSWKTSSANRTASKRAGSYHDVGWGEPGFTRWLLEQTTDDRRPCPWSVQVVLTYRDPNVI